MTDSTSPVPDLSSRIATVVERLVAAQTREATETLAAWSELFVVLGRAQQSSDAEAVELLREAADIEYDLLGECEHVGELLDDEEASLLLDEEDDPSNRTAPPTESRPPPSSLTFTRDRLLFLLEQAARLAKAEPFSSPYEIADRIILIREAFRGVER